MIEDLIRRVIEREGGYVNHPRDRGGPTNFGITQHTLAAWRGRAVTAEDVETVTRAEAEEIYRDLYWSSPRFDTISSLHPLIVEMLFDAAVNHGPSASVKMFQRACGVHDDGVIGPKTRAAALRHASRSLAANLIAQRVIEYGRIVTANPTQAAFAHGWARRAAEFIEKLGATA